MCNIQTFIKRQDYKFFDLYHHRRDSIECYIDYLLHLRYLQARCKCDYPNQFFADSLK